MSSTTTSLWANGRRPLSRRSRIPFLDLVSDVLREQPQQQGDLNAWAQLNPYLDLWYQEQYTHSRQFQEHVQVAITTIGGSFAKVSAREISREERITLRDAARSLIKYLDYLDRAEDSSVEYEHQSTRPPHEYFALLRRMYEAVEE